MYVRGSSGNISVKVLSAKRSSNICALQASSDINQGIFRATQSKLQAARLTCGTWLEGQKALEEIDRLEKGTLSHLSFVFPIRDLQCCRVAEDNIIKHERLPSLWAFMASVSISAVFHG